MGRMDVNLNDERLEYVDFTSVNLWGGPITVERLKCCDWSPHKFVEVNFSKLTDGNQIFRIDFVCIHSLPL